MNKKSILSKIFFITFCCLLVASPSALFSMEGEGGGDGGDPPAGGPAGPAGRAAGVRGGGMSESQVKKLLKEQRYKDSYNNRNNNRRDGRDARSIVAEVLTENLVNKKDLKQAFDKGVGSGLLEAVKMSSLCGMMQGIVKATSDKADEWGHKLLDGVGSLLGGVKDGVGRFIRGGGIPLKPNDVARWEGALKGIIIDLPALADKLSRSGRINTSTERLYSTVDNLQNSSGNNAVNNVPVDPEWEICLRGYLIKLSNLNKEILTRKKYYAGGGEMDQLLGRLSASIMGELVCQEGSTTPTRQGGIYFYLSKTRSFTELSSVKVSTMLKASYTLSKIILEELKLRVNDKISAARNSGSYSSRRTTGYGSGYRR